MNQLNPHIILTLDLIEPTEPIEPLNTGGWGVH